MLTYTAGLIDSTVVSCVGLMKWMGMEGPASLCVCVCVRAPPSYYTDYVCPCLNAVAEGFLNLFSVMRTFAFLVPMLFAKEGRGSVRHARNAQQCLGGPQWRFSFPCFPIILYVPII